MSVILKNMFGLLLLLIFSGLSSAQSKNEILTVTGEVEKPVNYTLEKIKSFPQFLITTNTPWTNEAHSYKGPKLEDILTDAKAKGSWLTLKALDKYQVTVDFERIRQFNPILAWEDNGKEMSVRGKGPLWVILPKDHYKELQSQIFNDYMVWQLINVEVLAKEP
ncbi:molybdopterin-dependent oxidoreductase [Vibrio sp. S9_S30]|uniref:molybdopterin-dependent oxidoreductase n=1 Tax=Vibrio sp. S9_S30 TaxID=2720226 RepID=UPI0016818C0D|nr:molybdopterin-dependent oxidoreductase [Vibrio sp. S9_S30]MBD1557106.1 molybdopterin-dependent oxidoreductase [Vibrio sp. S9_S30]